MHNNKFRFICWWWYHFIYTYVCFLFLGFVLQAQPNMYISRVFLCVLCVIWLAKVYIFLDARNVCGWFWLLLLLLFPFFSSYFLSHFLHLCSLYCNFSIVCYSILFFSRLYHRWFYSLHVYDNVFNNSQSLSTRYLLCNKCIVLVMVGFEINALCLQGRCII